MPRKVCAEPGCPTLTDRTRCTTHERARDRARGTRQERGYDRDHDQLRAAWAERINAGEIVHCHNPACRTPDQPVRPGCWHLGHTPDRSSWRGPEHDSCNLSEAGRASHGISPHD